MTSNRLYLRYSLLGLLLVFLLWLLVSAQGQRVADIFLRQIGGESAVDVDVRTLSPAMGEAVLKSRFPALPFECADKQTDFGERLCYSPLAAFNGAPAQYLSAFFRGDHLMALKLVYQRRYHDYLVRQLTREFGAANVQQVAGLPDTSGAQQWQVGPGWLVLPGVDSQAGAEPALFWLAAP